MGPDSKKELVLAGPGLNLMSSEGDELGIANPGSNFSRDGFKGGMKLESACPDLAIGM